MIYEHSTVDPVSKIQVEHIDQLYDTWTVLPEYHGKSEDEFYEFLKTPEAAIFILQYQSLSAEFQDSAVVLTSKFI